MFKFLVKVVIVVLALQSGVGYLQKQDVLIGDMKINYPVLKEKILKLIPTKKITEKLKDVVNSKISEAFAGESETKDDVFSESVKDYGKPRIVVHVVAQGETLAALSQKYGIPWQVIKKINDIHNENELVVGQQLRIPARVRNLT